MPHRILTPVPHGFSKNLRLTGPSVVYKYNILEYFEFKGARPKYMIFDEEGHSRI